MFKNLFRGALAGAAATTAMNAASYLDMAVRGRPASSTPERAVEELARRTDHPIPGTGAEYDHRVEGLGPLAGIVVGVGVGTLAGLVRPLFAKLPIVIGAPLLGGAAMAAAGGPVSALGVSDPRTCSTDEWLADAVPHLVYGTVLVIGLRLLGPRRAQG